MDDAELDDGVPLRISTWCHDCDGRGSKWMPRAGVVNGQPVQLAQMQKCKSCKGTGRLTGFQPPA